MRNIKHVGYLCCNYIELAKSLLKLSLNLVMPTSHTHARSQSGKVIMGLALTFINFKTLICEMLSLLWQKQTENVSTVQQLHVTAQSCGQGAAPWSPHPLVCKMSGPQYKKGWGALCTKLTINTSRYTTLLGIRYNATLWTTNPCWKEVS